MSDLFSTLTYEKGNIIVPGVHDLVLPLTPEEKALYATLKNGELCSFHYAWL